jgi:hypothetical protein
MGGIGAVTCRDWFEVGGIWARTPEGFVETGCGGNLGVDGISVGWKKTRHVWELENSEGLVGTWWELVRMGRKSRGIAHGLRESVGLLRIVQEQCLNCCASCRDSGWSVRTIAHCAGTVSELGGDLWMLTNLAALAAVCWTIWAMI